MEDAEYRERMLAILTQWVDESGGVRLFSPLCRKDLRAYGLSAQAVELLEAHCEIGRYADEQDHRARAQAVRKLLRAEGVKLRPGKRARPDLEKFVSDTCELLDLLGIKVATGEGSRAVRIIQRIGDELGIDGDPRNLMRRAVRREAQLAAFSYRVVVEAALRGARPDDAERPSDQGVNKR